jgi:hypothetical protein
MNNEGTRESREQRDGGNNKCKTSVIMDGTKSQQKNQVACGQRRRYNPYLKNKGEMPSSHHVQQGNHA